MERFVWKAASTENACFELHKRNMTRELTKDARIRCLVCQHSPKRGDSVYYPAAGLSENNKIIGHKECVDRVYNRMVAVGSGERFRDKIAPSLPVSVSIAPPAGSPTMPESKPKVNAKASNGNGASKSNAAPADATANGRITVSDSKKLGAGGNGSTSNGQRVSSDVSREAQLAAEVERLKRELDIQQGWRAGVEYAFGILASQGLGHQPPRVE